MYMASSLRAYCTFVTTFEAREANFFCREKVLQFPGRRCTIDEPNLVLEEFVAEENFNYCKNMSASEGVNADDKTVKSPTYHHLLKMRHPQRSSNMGLLPLTPHL
jgi:hypothetical protein